MSPEVTMYHCDFACQGDVYLRAHSVIVSWKALGFCLVWTLWITEMVEATGDCLTHGDRGEALKSVVDYVLFW